MKSTQTQLANEIELLYQPVINLATGCVTSAEVLPVWHKNAVLQDELTAEIRDWTLFTTCYQLNKWANAGYETLPFTINVPPQLAGRDFRERLDQVLGKNGIDLGHLEVAFTASALARSSQEIQENLLALSLRGVSLTLTDVDKYGSLELLDVFKFRTIKLARRLSKRLGEALTSGLHAACFIRVTQEMGAMLDLTIVATGVQTSDQARKYLSLECAYAQGTYIGRPVNAQAFQATYLSAAPRL